MSMRVLRRVGYIAILLCFLALFVSYACVVLLCRPDQQPVGKPSLVMPLRIVSFPSASGATLQGWFIDGQPGRGAILLLHGVHANRLAMLGRARFLSAAGYTVLVIDFQAHGESLGQHITFGYLEGRDAQAAIEFLRHAVSHERIGVIGVSMGGAAVLLADPAPKMDALVLEQVYPTIAEALDNRLRIYLGPLGKWIEPILTQEMSWHLGLDEEQLRPIDRIGRIQTPVLIIAGEVDRHTTLAQSQALFAAAKSPKNLWIVPGAAHVNLDKFAGAEYRGRVLDFFAQHLLHAEAQETARSIPSTATSTIKSISSGVMQNGGMK